MRLAFGRMMNEWTHTAAIITTIKNVNATKESDLEGIEDNHPLMIPKAEPKADTKEPTVSLWEMRGMKPPG